MLVLESSSNLHYVEVNKKHVSLKSYSLNIRIDSVNQMMRSKEKVKQIGNVNIPNRITDGKILCICSCLSNYIKNRGPYHSLRHTHDIKYFPAASLTQNQKEARTIHLVKEVGEV